VPNGSYDVYFYNWEDNNAATFSLFVEGEKVLSNYTSGKAGEWRLLGQYRVAIADGALDAYTTGGDAYLSGLILRNVNSAARKNMALNEASAWEPGSRCRCIRCQLMACFMLNLPLRKQVWLLSGL
jgi:hypothetical protein